MSQSPPHNQGQTDTQQVLHALRDTSKSVNDEALFQTHPLLTTVGVLLLAALMVLFYFFFGEPLLSWSLFGGSR